MEESILISTKKILGIDEDYEAFDLDIITHINAAFSILAQLGIGDQPVFVIEDEDPEWKDFITNDDVLLSSVKTYVYLKVRSLFDPPTTSYLIDAMDRQIREFEWRLNTQREATEWVDPEAA